MANKKFECQFQVLNLNESDATIDTNFAIKNEGFLQVASDQTFSFVKRIDFFKNNLEKPLLQLNLS